MYKKKGSGNYICGIWGSPTITPSVARILPYLAIEMETRGRDAWGGSDGESLIKHAGCVTDSWGEEYEWIETWQAGIFHTRGATSGTGKAQENAHPFEYTKPDGTTVIGIHNGVITNHQALNTKYSRSASVDSQHIWAHRAEGRDWDEILGWGNLVWWETINNERFIHLTRFNTDNLNVCRLKGGEWLFCSLQYPVNKIAKLFGNPVEKWFTIDEKQHYYFCPDQSQDGAMNLWKDPEKFKFGEKYPPQVATHSNIHHGGSRGRANFTPPWSPQGGNNNNNYFNQSGQSGYNSSAICFKCGQARIDGKEKALCGGCFALLVDAWKKCTKESIGDGGGLAIVPSTQLALVQRGSI